ncbi:MAG: UbiA family prenyltransferase [Leptolyngbyaceae cyanobacterium SL_7_1]|nr:UbiA family prenyltransferase [Leptolyngbyaceae cyanobacterium SL_7_1]
MRNQVENFLRQFTSLIRANEWWTFKLAPVIGTAYASAAVLNVSLISLWSTFLFLLISLIIGASYACLINDLTDREADQMCGKTNYMVGRSNLSIALILIICNGLGLAVLGLLIHSPLVLGVYLGNWLLFTIYSVPPIRLKEKGFWGVLTIAAAETSVPQIFAALLISCAADQSLPIMWLVLVAIWSLMAGLRSIFWHQILDLENDRLADIKTFAVNTSIQTLKQLGKGVVFPIEFLSFLGILLLSHNVLAWLFMCLYLLTEWLRHYFWKLEIVVVQPTGDHRLILFEYYDLFYPLGFLVQATWKDSANVFLLGIHLLFYYPRLWWWMRDLWGLLRWEFPNKLAEAYAPTIDDR